MCGIVGVYNYRANTNPIDQLELLRMRDAMLSRGPDGSGIWLHSDHSIGLAHRRLAILDLTENGMQPMSTSDNKLRITFNGEIYNYRELRNYLASKGHKFISDTDTEVLLYAYREYGQGMVDHLRGMFAFAIWDEEKRGLFLARDHFGIKPLYFHDDGNTFRCASQVKALLAGGGFETYSEPAGHIGFYLWGAVPEPYTLYRNLFALPAGHALWVDCCGPRAPHKYFDIAEELVNARETVLGLTSSEVLNSALRDSVRHHLVADVPVGVFLSSGLDSSTLTALASEEISQVRAVTLGFSEYESKPVDEVPLARKIAAHYGCLHHVGHISRNDFEKDLSNILHHMDQPSTDGINTWFVAKEAASAGLKVALSGLGGDELLGGYPSFRQLPKLVSWSQRFSWFSGLNQSLRIISAPLVRQFTSPKYASLMEYGDSYGGAYLLRRGLFMPWELPHFLDGEFVREGWETLQPVLRLDEWLSGLNGSYAKVAALELAFYMRNQLLRDSDWAGMAHSVEIRVPFVDITLFRTIAPFLAKGINPPSKKNLTDIPKLSLPDDVVKRPKTGFLIPVHEWMESQNKYSAQRGLRGWSFYVHQPEKAKNQPSKKTKRVIALLPDAFGGRGGIAKFNRDLLWALSSSPSVSHVVAIPRRIHEKINDMPLKLRYDISGINGKVSFLRALWRILKSTSKADMVLCGHLNLLPLAWFVAWTRRAPLWCVIHGIDAWQSHKSWLVRRLLRRVNKVVAVSELTSKRFSSWSGISRGKIDLLPNCYDPSQFFPAPKNESLLDRYSLRDKTVLMTVGRLAGHERYKGFDEVIELLPELAREIPSITYLIAGEGDDRMRLQQKAAELGTADRVVFTGYVEETEKTDLYRLAHTYVMPSRGEGFGIVFLEAMACGIPAIGSKVDGSREALADGRLGILIDPSKPNEIRSAIHKSLRNRTGNPPVGLEEYSLGRFRDRVWNLLTSSNQSSNHYDA